MGHHTSIQYEEVVHARTPSDDQYVRCGHLTGELGVEKPQSPKDIPSGAFVVDPNNIGEGVSVCIACYPRTRSALEKEE